jgi:hypothetical protein
VTEGAERGKNPQSLKSFEYHCAHSYWAYNEVTSAVFQAEGEKVNDQVLEDFAQDYGKEMADVIWGYRNTNFNVID